MFRGRQRVSFFIYLYFIIIIISIVFEASAPCCVGETSQVRKSPVSSDVFAQIPAKCTRKSVVDLRS